MASVRMKHGRHRSHREFRPFISLEPRTFLSGNLPSIALSYFGDTTEKNAFNLEARVGTAVNPDSFPTVPSAPTAASATLNFAVPTTGISSISTNLGTLNFASATLSRGSLTNSIIVDHIVFAYPTGTVIFSEGNTLLGTATINATTGIASLHLTTALAYGPHTITAAYLGDSQYSPVTSAPGTLFITHGNTTTTLTVSAPVEQGSNAAITLTATTTTQENERLSPTGTIAFHMDDFLLATVPVSESNSVTFTPSPGGHLFSAKYSGDDYFFFSRSGTSPLIVTYDAVSAPPSDPNAAVVTRLYHDVLHRIPDPDGLTSWAVQLQAHTATPADIASAFIHSTEYRTELVQSLYNSILDRDADTNGLHAWLAFFAAGNTLEQMKAYFYGSQEFFNNHGNSNTALVTTYYQTFLGRDPDATGMEHWVALLDQGADRHDIVWDIQNGSTEGAQGIVKHAFESLLHRLPDDAGLDYWTRQLQSGVSEVALTLNIVSSSEYFNIS